MTYPNLQQAGGQYRAPRFVCGVRLAVHAEPDMIERTQNGGRGWWHMGCGVLTAIARPLAVALGKPERPVQSMVQHQTLTVC